MEGRQDILLGLIFAALGSFAAVQAAAYSGASGVYPMALGVVMAAMGAAVAFKGLLRGAGERRPLTAHAGRVLLTAGLAAGYIALVPRLGFFTASALVVLALPLALGFRRPLYLLLVTAIFLAIVWGVFTVALEKPLPDEFWTSY